MLLALSLNGYAQSALRDDVNSSSAAAQSDWVDLGLPSGTLWATRNIGAASPEDYGDYFAWGETSPKALYNWENYKWWNEGTHAQGNRHSGHTKYVTESEIGLCGFVDDKAELELADDAAAANWGGGARMPSLAQLEELVDKCTWRWERRNGVDGQLVTGPNGNSIFLPATGYSEDGSIYGVDYRGYYWSRALHVGRSSYAYYLCFDSDSVDWSYHCHRFVGHAVRAVRIP